MYIFHLFRSFLPLHNPIGFGASDFLELLLALLLVLFALVWRPFLQPYAVRFAARTGWCMLLLAVLPVALRLLLLPHHPSPAPDVYDEFSHLLVADTLRHFRLANPPHPLSEFFETQFVLQQPTYSSIYPIGQGIALALGRMLLRYAMGRSDSLDQRFLRIVLLDVASVDRAAMGAGRGAARGYAIRSAEPVDE